MRTALVLLISCTLPGCDSDTGPRPLAEACESRECPKTQEEAVGVVCDNPQGTGQWEEGPNGCGGWSVGSANSGVGVRFDFDARGRLVGIESWTDTLDGGRLYGTLCTMPGPSRTTKDCPELPDAGSRD